MARASGGCFGRLWVSSIALFSTEHTGSLCIGSSWFPTGLLQGSEYASKLNASLSIFLFTVFLPHSLLSCSLIACNSLPKWIILSMAAWLPPHSWRLNWLESTSKETIASSSPRTEPRVTTYGSRDSALVSLKHSCLPRDRAGQARDLGPTYSWTEHCWSAPCKHLRDPVH